MSIPQVTLSSSLPMPALGLGTGGSPFTFDVKKKLAVLHAIELGYRHFDTTSLYQSEQPVGEAIAKALRLRIIQSRDDLFVTSKLWCTHAHPHLVLPAIRDSLRNLKLDYLDLYLIHWPMSLKPGACTFPVRSQDILPLDLKSVWEAMEECQRLGLAKSIGVCNFTRKKLVELLAVAKIPPAVNQVEMNPMWQQKKLREFCKEKGIHVIAYSPLGGQAAPGSSSSNLVMESEVLKDIAKAKGKSAAQVSLRWIYEQGASMVAKSLNKERLEDNKKIFHWELNDEELQKISQIPQCKRITTHTLLSPEDRLKSLDLLDVDIAEEL